MSLDSLYGFYNTVAGYVGAGLNGLNPNNVISNTQDALYPKKEEAAPAPSYLEQYGPTVAKVTGGLAAAYGLYRAGKAAYGTYNAKYEAKLDAELASKLSVDGHATVLANRNWVAVVRNMDQAALNVFNSYDKAGLTTLMTTPANSVQGLAKAQKNQVAGILTKFAAGKSIKLLAAPAATKAAVDAANAPVAAPATVKKP